MIMTEQDVVLLLEKRDLGSLESLNVHVNKELKFPIDALNNAGQLENNAFDKFCHNLIGLLKEAKNWSSNQDLVSVIKSNENFELFVESMEDSGAKKELLKVVGYDKQYYEQLMVAVICYLEESN